MIVRSLRSIFNGQYPVADFADLNVTIEFPVKKQDYPAIWVDFDDTEPAQKAGIGYLEEVKDADGIEHFVTRWRFAGNLSFTVAAMSSLERDRLYDEMVRVIAATGVDDTHAGGLKALVEDNDLIGLNLNYDVITPSGNETNPGTPWATNEIIYEKTLTIGAIGEFVSDPSTNKLVPLSKVIFTGYLADDVDPNFPFTDEKSTVTAYDPTQWA